MSKRKYLTKSQARILDWLAGNGGTGVISHGVRYAVFRPGRAWVFSQALHALLQNRWITSRGQNEKCGYAMTEAGREVQRNRWYQSESRVAYWQDVKPEPALREYSDHETA